MIDDDFGGPGNTVPNTTDSEAQQLSVGLEIGMRINEEWALHLLATYLDVDVKIPGAMPPVRRDISGFGDSRLWVERSWRLGETTGESGDEGILAFGIGLRIPTGEAEPPQVVGGVPSSTLQTGTETWDPFAVITASRPIGRVIGFASVELVVPLMENDFDYRPGRSAHLTVGTVVHLSERVDLVPSAGILYREPDRVDGTSLFASGGLWILAGVEGVWRIAEHGELWVHLEAPLARNLRTPTLESNVRITLGASVAF